MNLGNDADTVGAVTGALASAQQGASGIPARWLDVLCVRERVEAADRLPVLDDVARYRERIAQAEMLQEYGLRRALEDILIIEEEHARDLQSALDM